MTTNTETKHAPTPYHVYDGSNIRDANNRQVATVSGPHPVGDIKGSLAAHERDHATAAFLVHAANHHEELRAALADLLSKPSNNWQDSKWVTVPGYEPCAEGEGFFLTPHDIAEGKARRILSESATQ